MVVRVAVFTEGGPQGETALTVPLMVLGGGGRGGRGGRVGEGEG